MVRTQIQLKDEQHRALRKAARRRGVSLSETVRQCVSEHLAREEQAPSRAELIRNALSVLGKYRDPKGPSNVAEEHDRYLAEAYRR